MGGHPYKQLPEWNYWKRSVAEQPLDRVDPVVSGKFRIGPADKVATAGSCFAQHIARHLKGSGFNYFVTEHANPAVPGSLAASFGYGVYTARYGNIYTPRQLVQLLKRAYGLFHPADDVWMRDDGRLIDPFRPQIQPDGFASRAEYDADRRQHLAAVRRAVEQLDVFIFTLGLTETWLSREDGAVYPVCPGVAGGSFDERRHVFRNMRAAEIAADLRESIAFIRRRNPSARFMLTVSPVPLVATAEPRSVLVSTTYSKAALRVAAEETSSDDEGVAYFPSYEIITGQHARGRYFADDLRSVTEEGVGRVMALFMQHYTRPGLLVDVGTETIEGATRPGETARGLAVERAVAVMCDEEALDR
jgi:hypothetical protein